MSKRNHVMFDMETLAKGYDAVIVTLGAIKFDPFGDDRDKATRTNPMYYGRYEIGLQEEKGRVICEDTMKWWSRQDKAAQDEAFGDGDDRVELDQGLEDFNKFFNGVQTGAKAAPKGRFIWGHGSMFDVRNMEHAYRQFDVAVPWHYPSVRDTRTLFDLGVSADMPKGEHHHALADAMRQVIGVQNCYRKLGITKP